jgi:RNAse (barnase) inhibitor barstar
VEQLHAQLQEKLQFPAFYGKNWDAFWDAITGLVELPERIRLLGWASFEARFPRDASIMQKCLSDYRQNLGERASEFEYN